MKKALLVFLLLFSVVFLRGVLAEDSALILGEDSADLYRVFVDGEQISDSLLFSGIKNVSIELSDGLGPKLVFEHDFSTSDLDLSYVGFIFGPSENLENVLAVTGLENVSGPVEVHMIPFNWTSQEVCVGKNVVETELSPSCNASGEILLVCDGSELEGMRCTNDKGEFVLSGLQLPIILREISPKVKIPDEHPVKTENSSFVSELETVGSEGIELAEKERSFLVYLLGGLGVVLLLSLVFLFRKKKEVPSQSSEGKIIVSEKNTSVPPSSDFKRTYEVARGYVRANKNKHSKEALKKVLLYNKYPEDLVNQVLEEEF